MDVSASLERVRPSFLILPINVVLLIPSIFAAPLGPPITQSAALIASRMNFDSACARVFGATDISRSGKTRLSRGATSDAPGDIMTARSMKFCSSRIFPGQQYCERACIVSSGTVSTRRFSRRTQSLTNAFTSNGMSSRRSRRGGRDRGKMFSRKNRSLRKVPWLTICFKSLWVAATIRTFTC